MISITDDWLEVKKVGSADGIRTHITLAENELSLLPLDDDATKIVRNLYVTLARHNLF